MPAPGPYLVPVPTPGSVKTGEVETFSPSLPVPSTGLGPTGEGFIYLFILDICEEKKGFTIKKKTTKNLGMGDYGSAHPGWGPIDSSI